MRRRDAWSLVLALGMTLPGCRTTSRPSDAEPEPPMAPLMAPPAGCDELGAVLLSVEPAQLSLTCKDEFRDCSGRAKLTVHNCAARAFELHEVLMSPAPPMRAPVVRAGGMIRLEPGGTWAMELELDQMGVYELSLGPVAMSPGPSISVGTTTLTIDNPAREQAIGACRECNGDWGRHGMLGIESCNCRTRDGGTPCDDGSDCEGECMARAGQAAFTCARFSSNWGCYAYLPDGWSKERHPENATAHYVCAD
jgi:hypothetical protein